MKILGLFMVVFVGVIISRALGFSDVAITVGAVVGACSYILLAAGGSK